ncbi:GAF and ANTAR domain-containing protein, partial [Blastococcus sp. CCUG 61487]|uniref:ANTAR domain-containing response regulator n=1 Tax=Blastococcus sp. CCUG 61487 TaxID=1840703 RepID=UPI001BAFB451
HPAGRHLFTEIVDPGTDTRWRDYVRYALERGCLSAMSVPLPVPEPLGAGLNVYARTPGAFDDESRRAAIELARSAGVAVSNVYANQNERERARNLATALESRAVIERAKAILIERFGLTADQAFQTLARVSMQTNSKLRDVADRLVMTGELPGLP